LIRRLWTGQGKKKAFGVCNVVLKKRPLGAPKKGHPKNRRLGVGKDGQPGRKGRRGWCGGKAKKKTGFLAAQGEKGVEPGERGEGGGRGGTNGGNVPLLISKKSCKGKKRGDEGNRTRQTPRERRKKNHDY